MKLRACRCQDAEGAGPTLQRRRKMRRAIVAKESVNRMAESNSVPRAGDIVSGSSKEGAHGTREPKRAAAKATARGAWVRARGG